MLFHLFIIYFFLGLRAEELEVLSLSVEAILCKITSYAWKTWILIFLAKANKSEHQ